MPGRYRELEWCIFGTWVGLRSWLTDGARLGMRKTAGKILKPINSYSRFPEYYLFASGIKQFMKAHSSSEKRAAILDIGSPKPFGLYLAFHLNAEINLTDITRFNLDQDEVLWSAISGDAKGSARFELQDARSLSYANEQFDIVYSMSVVEHIEGDLQDKVAISEMLRVLKPGGLLLLSLPCGPYYQEQQIAGRPHLNDDSDDTSLGYFQRIYDADAFDTRIISVTRGLVDQIQIYSVYRRDNWLTRAFYRARPVANGNGNRVLGLINPIWSMCINQHVVGVNTDFLYSYGPVFSLKDIYGDFVLICRKRQ